jgi:hypothetical protein
MIKNRVGYGRRISKKSPDDHHAKLVSGDGIFYGPELVNGDCNDDATGRTNPCRMHSVYGH